MAKRERKVPFNCYLSVGQLDALDIASEREGRPRAEIVREAVQAYLAKVGEEESMPPASGAVSGERVERAVSGRQRRRKSGRESL